MIYGCLLCFDNFRKEIDNWPRKDKEIYMFLPAKHCTAFLTKKFTSIKKFRVKTETHCYQVERFFEDF